MAVTFDARTIPESKIIVQRVPPAAGVCVSALPAEVHVSTYRALPTDVDVSVSRPY